MRRKSLMVKFFLAMALTLCGTQTCEAAGAEKLSEAGAPSTQAARIDDLAWLAGCWAGQNGRSEFHEQWMKPAGGMMLGMSRTLADGKLVSHESMRIMVLGDGSIAFIPKPAGKPEATFNLMKSGEHEMVFAAQREEFPQQVSYRLNEDGSLHARIEGMRGGQLRGIDFPMRRVRCD